MSRLDAAGCTLQQVFGENKMDSESELVSETEEIYVPLDEVSVHLRKQEFKNWIINLDVWGSFEPLNPQCYDI